MTRHKNLVAAHHIGEFLMAKGLISPDQLRVAEKEQAKNNSPNSPNPPIELGKILVSLGFIREQSLQEALSNWLGKETVNLKNTLIDKDALAKIPEAIARQFRVLPLQFDEENQSLILATNNAHDILAQDRIKARIPNLSRIHTVLANESDLERAIDLAYGYELSIDGILAEIEHLERDKTNKTPSNDAEEYAHPVVRLIDALLSDAVKSRASDVHFEPENGFIRIRYRIDGILLQIRALHASYWAAMAVRIKILCGMNIAETRAPQDGRLSRSLGNRTIDFRASAQPTLFGENIVLRILDRHKGLLAIDELGLKPEALALLLRMIQRPEGIILVTGPTGSGKTTTLYSILNHINAPEINIMTLEDPVEYPLLGVRQSSVTDSAKLDFANGIRSLMRQDPDVILVGEIRDEPTAQMALRASMTGHQVYSTVHANSALGVIPRLLDIGILPPILAGNLIGIIAQRLLRSLCTHCKTAYFATSEEMQLLHLPAQNPIQLYKAAGCEKCRESGFMGRFAIMEIIRIDEDFDVEISEGGRAHRLKKLAKDKGFLSLAEDGIFQVIAGKTSLAELSRVVDLST